MMSNVCQKWCKFVANENEGNSKSHVDEQSGNTITWIHFNSVQWKEKLVHMCVKYDVHSVATMFSIFVNLRRKCLSKETCYVVRMMYDYKSAPHFTRVWCFLFHENFSMSPRIWVSFTSTLLDKQGFLLTETTETCSTNWTVDQEAQLTREHLLDS